MKNYNEIDMRQTSHAEVDEQEIDGMNLYLDRTLHEEFEQFCESLGQTKTVAAERAFRMYMDTMKQNPEQIMKERRSD